jgi:hypothetical protein
MLSCLRQRSLEEDVKPSLDLLPTSVSSAPLQSSSVSSQFYQSDVKDFFEFFFKSNETQTLIRPRVYWIGLQPTVVQNNKYEKYVHYFSLFLDFFSLILAAFFFRFSNCVAGHSFSSGRLTLLILSPMKPAQFDSLHRHFVFATPVYIS